MKKALIFGFMAMSLTTLAVVRPALADVNSFTLPRTHDCTPEQIDFTVKNISVIERNCSADSLIVMRELTAQLGTCNLATVAPAWMLKIGKASVAYASYEGKCAVQRAQAEAAARRAAARQQQQQQQDQQQQSEQ